MNASERKQLTDSTYQRLCAGDWGVAASDRAARALAASFHHLRRLEGLTAWPAPYIYTWQSFVTAAWAARTLDGRMRMSAAQEQSVWEEIIAGSQTTAALIEGPRHRLAGLAREAHELLCAYAPRSLDKAARSAWQQDAEAFSEWLASFDLRCRAEGLLSASRLPLELIPVLRKENAEKKNPNRARLILVGFDRLLPMQREIFDLWGEWELTDPSQSADKVCFHQAKDAASELAACVVWCDRQLNANPAARLLVISQDVGKRRGELERAFERYLTVDRVPAFEFSLGVPLRRVPLVQGAALLLRWLSAPLAEHEVDWLFSTGQIAADSTESAALQAVMRNARRQQRERPEWTLTEFCEYAKRAAAKLPEGELKLPQITPLAGWVARMSAATNRLAEMRGSHPPLEWSAVVPEILSAVGWPGDRSLSSAEHQAHQRLAQAVDDCGTLGFDGRRIGWNDFRMRLEQTLDEALFSLESREAPILISGPAESAGLSADGIWFLGAEEGQWPASGSTHPLLPIFVQREAGMPHATAELDWELARTTSQRLMASAGEVHFSSAKLRGDVEGKPSRLIVQLAGDPQPLLSAAETQTAAHNESQPQTEPVEEWGGIAYPHPTVRGGAQVLTLQSQCAFRAFATTRLVAKGWELAEAGLTAAQRGNLLHKVMHAVWAGPDEEGLRTLDDLKKLLAEGAGKSLESFVVAHVQRVVRNELPPELRHRLPTPYIELEETRLTRLVSEWLLYESTRQAFEVIAREEKRTVDVAGIALDLRLDRMDKLADGSWLVIDYKTGDVKPKMWDLPRPEDVQLPLYAGFALNSDTQTDSKESLGGLVFAKIRAGQVEFSGKLRHAKETFLSELPGSSSLVKYPLTDNELYDWQDAIEQLADEFIKGRAVVDPRDAPKTCEHCELPVLCRITEKINIDFEEDSEEEGSDE